MDRKPATNNTPICSLPIRQTDYILPEFVSSIRNVDEPSRDVPLRKNPAPFTFVSVKCEPTELPPEIVEAETVVRLDHCYDISRFRDCSSVEEEYLGLSIKSELKDSESKAGWLSAAVIKTESIDIPEDYLINGHQVWAQEDARTVHDADRGDERRGGKLSDFLKSDKALNSFTGIPNNCVLNEIAKRMRSVSPRFAKNPSLRLTLEDRIIMTFAKLKQGLNYEFLSVFFKCKSRNVCRRIVLRTLDVLGDCLGSLISWDFSSKNFRKFESTERDIGCFVNRIEIEIAKSKKVADRVATRSRYKHWHSVKFITAVTPEGFVCLVSPPLGGRISHELAFERSNVIASRGRNDAIVILKEFRVDDFCRRNNVRLVRSFFSRNDQGNSIPEGSRTSLNVNRKIRSFRVFRRKLSPSLHRRAYKIVTAICGLENLRKSILNETKPVS